MQNVSKFKNDERISHCIVLLEDPNASDSERNAAEGIVKEACLEYGELILHGDLLTVKMIQEARMNMSSAATAFERLEFLGPCRLQMLHMKMKKVVQDFSIAMKEALNYDDVLSLAWSAALSRMKVGNKEKDIKKNDSSFERHDQFITAVQTSYLVNLFDNYLVKYPEKLDRVDSTDSAVQYIIQMLQEFNIQWYYDPNTEDTSKGDEDDLFRYCKVLFLL